MDLKVTTMLQVKVRDSRELPNGRQELTLSDGTKVVTDLYIPAFGLIPNSSYIPAKFLNSNGFVVVDEYLRVKGVEDVWAVGDVSSIEPPQFKTTDTQSAHLAKNILLILNNKKPLPYAIGSRMDPLLLLQDLSFADLL